MTCGEEVREKEGKIRFCSFFLRRSLALSFSGKKPIKPKEKRSKTGSFHEFVFLQPLRFFCFRLSLIVSSN